MTIPEQVQNDILMHKKVKITVLRTEYYVLNPLQQ